MTTTTHTYSHDASRFDRENLWSFWTRSHDDNRGDSRGDDRHHDDGNSSYCHDHAPEPKVLSVSDSRAVEGNAEIFTVTLSGAVHGSLDVSLALAGGSATAGSDFRSAMEVSFDGGSSWSKVGCQNVTVGAGVDAFMVRVATIDDKLVETTETFTLSASANGGSDCGTGTIVDNDAPAPAPKVVSVSDASTVEGGMEIFTVTLSEAGSTATSVQLSLLAGSAASGDDYANSIQASFDGGATWSAVTGGNVSVPQGHADFLLRVATVDDFLVEANEVFSLTASAGGGSATGVGTITDNDAALPALKIADAEDFEGTPLVFDLAFASTPLTAGVIRLTLADGTATAGSDYQNALEVSHDGGTSWSAIGTDGQLHVAAGESALQVRVQTIDDANPEPVESFTLNATILTGSGNVTATGSIIDNDFAFARAGATSGAALLAADVLSDATPLAASSTAGASAASCHVQVAAALLLPADDLLRQQPAQPVAFA